jgi:uncharacterized protein (TIGR01244 family)
MTRLLLIAALALLPLGCGTEAAKAPAPAHNGAVNTDWKVEPANIGSVPNLTRFGPLYFSGQPAQADWVALKQAGTAVIVNLRDDVEHPGYDQSAAVKAQGFSDYLHIELRAGGWARPDLERVFGLMDAAAEKNQPTLVHCASSNRSGAVFWAWLVHRGYSVDDAKKLAVQAGMTSEERAATAYIRKHLQ